MLCIRTINKYEPAPGKVTKNLLFDDGVCWTHGNFVARRKRSGCFSFLPAPRKLFFFEVKNGEGSIDVTCTPLDEPVTEAYSVLGFPLWWSKAVVANLIPFARHALVAFIFHILAFRRLLHVDMTMYMEYVKCATNAPLCCIQMFLSLAVLVRANESEYGTAER